ncbi:hypothetical protein D7X33_11595 [Butyricicoccus sp. 1XD8-22]|nr:hypothetical protein D7X33_11595 [Butyricicoccus sp. 1XD8-22]
MKTKWQYSLPVKFLALLLLTVFLSGAMTGLIGVVFCGDAGLFEENYAAPSSPEQYVQTTSAYRAIGYKHRWEVNDVIEYFAKDVQTETISSREWLSLIRTRYEPENTNLRVVLENPQTGRTLLLSDLLGLQGNYFLDDHFALVISDTYHINNVTGGPIAAFLGIGSQTLPETQAEADTASEKDSRRIPYDENGFPILYDENGSRVLLYDEDGHLMLYDEGNSLALDGENGSHIFYDEDGDAILFDADSGTGYYQIGPYVGSVSSEDEPTNQPAEINVYYYLHSELPVSDDFLEEYYNYLTLRDIVFPTILLAIGGGLLALMCWIWLMCAAGHRPNTDREVITLRFIDRIPLDLFLCLWGCVLSAVSVILVQGVFNGPVDLFHIDENRALILAGVIVSYALLSIILTTSVAVRWKSHTLLRNTLVWRVCAWCWRLLSGGAGKVAGRFPAREKRGLTPEEQAEKQKQRAETMDKMGKGAQKAAGAVSGAAGSAWEWFTRQCGRLFSAVENLFQTLPLVWKGLVLLLVIALANIFLLVLVIDGDAGFIAALLMFGFNLTMIWEYMNVLKQMHWLHEGAKRIAAGDLEYRLPAEVMKWEFKAHAEALNAIRDGIDTAVEERVQAVEERIKSERMRTELLTNVSHDIKTPLTSIINYVGLLKKEPIEGEKAQEYLDVLDRQSGRLKKLLEDLLEASKASTGNITVNAAPTSVGELLRQVTGEYAEKLTAAGLEPIITLPAHDAMIFADGRLLWRVFDNLMANIVKYAMPQTRVYFDLRSDASVTAIAVKNVSRERLNIAADELMERFVRGDQSRSTEGSGLGLSIAQSLTELMGGSFELVIDGDLFKVQISFPTLHGSPDPKDDAPLSEIVTVSPSPIVQPVYGAAEAPAAHLPTIQMQAVETAAAVAAQTSATEVQDTADEVQTAEAEVQDTADAAQATDAEVQDTTDEVQATEDEVQSPANETQTAEAAMQDTTDEVQTAEAEVQDTADAAQATDAEVQDTTDEVQATEDEVQGTADAVQTAEAEVQDAPDKAQMLPTPEKQPSEETAQAEESPAASFEVNQSGTAVQAAEGTQSGKPAGEGKPDAAGTTPSEHTEK